MAEKLSNTKIVSSFTIDGYDISNYINSISVSTDNYFEAINAFNYKTYLCKDISPRHAYLIAETFGKKFSYSDVINCENIIINNLYYLVKFCELNIPGINFDKLQSIACTEPGYALAYAKRIFNADMLICRKACESSPNHLKEIDKLIVEKSIV